MPYANTKEALSDAFLKMRQRNPEFIKIYAVLKLDLQGPKGGVFCIDFKDSAKITEGECDADVTISCAAADFIRLLDGDVTRKTLIREKKLSWSGEKSHLQQMSKIFDVPRSA